MADEIITTDKDAGKVGRPCKYNSHVEPYLEDIFEWLKEGYTDISICKQLGINQDTWIKYREEYSDLSNLYTRARAHRNALVMNKMYERATGYQHPDLFIAQNKGEIVKEEIIKHYPPDVQAADLFLRNNDPDYKGPKSVESGNITINNFQLPEARQKVEQLLTEREKLKAIDVASFEVVEAE